MGRQVVGQMKRVLTDGDEVVFEIMLSDYTATKIIAKSVEEDDGLTETWRYTLESGDCWIGFMSDLGPDDDGKEYFELMASWDTNRQPTHRAYETEPDLFDLIEYQPSTNPTRKEPPCVKN